MVPVYSKNYLVSFIRPNPDLYGKRYPLNTGNLLDNYVVCGFLEPVKSFSASSVACSSIVSGLGSIVYAFVCLLFA